MAWQIRSILASGHVRARTPEPTSGITSLSESDTWGIYLEALAVVDVKFARFRSLAGGAEVGAFSEWYWLLPERGRCSRAAVMRAAWRMALDRVGLRELAAVVADLDDHEVVRLAHPNFPIRDSDRVRHDSD